MIDPTGNAFQFLNQYLQQVQVMMVEKGIVKKQLSSKMSVGLPQISRLLDATNNRTIQQLTNMATAIRCRVVPVVYEGRPVDHEVFHALWERAGKPRKLEELEGS